MEIKNSFVCLTKGNFRVYLYDFEPLRILRILSGYEGHSVSTIYYCPFRTPPVQDSERVLSLDPEGSRDENPEGQDSEEKEPFPSTLKGLGTRTLKGRVPRRKRN